jgi:exopolyphosphatase/pppGpp-phosphohydrolase
MIVLWTILERSKCEKVYVSTLGVREGYLMTKLLKVNFLAECPIVLKNDFEQELGKYPEVDTEIS